MKLGNLKKTDLREIWPHEARDFTNWVSQPENISILSEELGININVLQTEAEVGRFNVDILAEEEETEQKVVIENQLENTDHTHLGQIITYASGLEAKYIIWIVKDVREEHRQAIDWLNEHTDNDVNFFLVIIELWRIDRSDPAPKFVIVSKPNNWKKAMMRGSRGNELSNIELFRMDFWTNFHKYLKDNDIDLKPEQPRPNHWCSLRLGKSDRHISFTTNTRKSAITCDFNLYDKELFRKIYESKDKIESQLDLGQLGWHELPEKKVSVVRISTECDLKNSESWTEGYAWLSSVGLKFRELFSNV